MTELMASVLNVLYQQSIWAGILFPAVLVFAYGLRRAYPGLLMAIWLLIPLRLIAPTDLAFEYSLAEWLSTLPIADVMPAPGIERVAEGAAGVYSHAEFSVDSDLSAIEYTLFALWLCGFLWCLLRFLKARRHLRKLARQAKSLKFGECHSMLQEARAAFSCRRRIQLVISSNSHSAYTLGTIQPIICLPGKLWCKLSREDQRAIIYHEVAHVKACDDLLLYGLNLIRCAFFFHPAICYAQAQISQQRERLTDIAVVQSNKIPPRQYARALLNYIEQSTLHRFESVAPGVGGQYLLMKIRIEAMMSNRVTPLPWQKVAALLLMALMMGLVLPMDTLAKSGQLDKTEALTFSPPMDPSWISSNFGMRKHPLTGKKKFHKGIDLPAALGTEVYAVAAGKVLRIKSDSVNKPNYVVIDHGQGLVSRYFQIGEVQVEVNEQVQPGQVIAKIASPYLGTGPHLHFELHKDNKAIDPLLYLYQ
ncbi:M23/M56 family metallopeptidase [Pseudoteredinibacter isoporae]|uniref:M23/M56 family metallopeptidase n=1 Tax=Pseudoteredinibacter isoporae TaxID=570281 RepID=UPI0031033280